MQHQMPPPIVQSARGWIGTRFVHQGRLKKTEQHAGGVDCLGLLIGVAKELNIQSRQGLPFWQLDETDYSKTPDHQRLAAILSNHLYVKSIEDLQVGDIGLFSIQQSPQHLAIFSTLDGSPAIIHAYAQARKVVEHALDDYWRKNIVTIYSVYS